MDKEKNKNKRLWIILAIVVFVLIATVAVLVIILLNKKNGDDSSASTQTVSEAGILAYETSAIATDPETLQDLYNEMLEKAKEGTMALEMQTEAISSDGTEFSCYIANAINNEYDMFVVIYLDDTQEEIYRSGLIPLGSRLESFKSSKKLEPGTYVATIVYNQVEDDHATIHAQVNIGLNLNVK